MDDATRHSLHQKLDDLLDRRSIIDSASPDINNLNALAAYAAPRDLPGARLIFRETLALAREVLGDRIRSVVLPRHYETATEQRLLLSGWLLSLLPVLHMRPPLLTGLLGGKKQLTIFDVVDALSALDAGEIQPIFQATTGKNRRANRWSLARGKLDALAWKKRLLALGYAEKSANYEVTVGFGEQWDTIRKWKRQCEEILGEYHVRAELDFAGSETDLYVTPSRAGMLAGVTADPLLGLKRAGEKYRHELARSAELSKRKGKTKNPAVDE